jgi:hypothetical protein
MFVRRRGGVTTVVLIYVDDILAFSDAQEELDGFRDAVEQRYAVNNFAGVSRFVGMEMAWASNHVVIHQSKYASGVLKRFGMAKSKPAATPANSNLVENVRRDVDVMNDEIRSVIGSLLYASTVTRPDLSTAVRILAQQVDKPTRTVMCGIDQVLRYLNGACDCGLIYKAREDIEAEWVVYVDSAFAVERDRHSTTGYAIFYHGNLVSRGNNSPTNCDALFDRVGVRRFDLCATRVYWAPEHNEHTWYCSVYDLGL